MSLIYRLVKFQLLLTSLILLFFCIPNRMRLLSFIPILFRLKSINFILYKSEWNFCLDCLIINSSLIEVISFVISDWIRGLNGIRHGNAVIDNDSSTDGLSRLCLNFWKRSNVGQSKCNALETFFKLVWNSLVISLVNVQLHRRFYVRWEKKEEEVG